MKLNVLQTSTILLTGLLFQFGARGQNENDLESLLSQLSSKPLDQRVLWRLEAKPPDARTIPALRQAFDQRDIKEEKQWIAASLVHLGDETGKYYDYLAGYAKKAVEDPAPWFAQYDQAGRSVRGEFSAEFENWCAQNGKDPRAVAALQSGVYFEDMMMLAKVNDRRSLDLFHRGLESPNPMVLAASVQGLARLQDVAAIPAITKAADRLHVEDRLAIAMDLPWYSAAEAEQLLERLIPAPSHRELLRNDVQRQREFELKIIKSRTAPIAPK